MIYTVTLNPTIDRTLHYAELHLGELNRASSARIDLSGKGVNVSMALRCLGLDSRLLGFAGGVSGRVLVQGLEAQGYICDFVAVDGETRSNITVIDDATGITTKLNEAGAAVTEADLLALESKLADAIGADDLCIFSGSLPPGAPVDTYARLIGVVRSRGAVSVLDTSGAALAAGIVAGPDWAKPNEVEAAELVGAPVGDADLKRVAGMIRDLGPKRVLMSLGSRGAVYADGTGVWHAMPPPIREVSAVAAGDASLAGGLRAWLQGLCSEEIVRWAVATGTATAMEDGSAMPAIASVEAVLARVQVAPL